MGCASALEEAWTGARPQFLEEDLERFMGMAFMGTNGEVEMGSLRGSARLGLLSMQGGSEARLCTHKDTRARIGF